nr:phosphatidylinositol 5-phosphate 4-kinase type-2 alpha-like isoform X2 [Nerophis lumbriciformis]
MLMPDDFKAYSKIKEYCPLVFRNLRERFGIDDQDFLNSLTRSAPLNSEAQGRSGARFHTSYDKRYVIKTISSEDVAEMHNILKKYHQFIVECHGNTLLPQFLGMYRLTVDGDATYMIVTRNVFSHRLSVFKKYDLKGSTVAREASDKEKAKELPTYKDNDFINDGQKICINDDNKKMFLEKLRKDVEFLAQLKLMDYSLLVGIHDVERAEQEEVESEDNEAEEEGVESDGGAVGTPPDSPSNTLDSTKPLSPGEFDPTIDVYAIKSSENAPRKEVYFMAIIDILQHYDAKKKAAHAAKTVKHGAGAEISTVNPEQYSKRFHDFITTILS